MTSISPSRADTSDDLPAPTWPTTATRLPSGTEKEILKVRRVIHVRKQYFYIYPSLGVGLMRTREHSISKWLPCRGAILRSQNNWDLGRQLGLSYEISVNVIMLLYNDCKIQRQQPPISVI